MSSAYGPLAAWYDKLTLDVPYEDFLCFYEREFSADGGESFIQYSIFAAEQALLHG